MAVYAVLAKKVAIPGTDKTENDGKTTTQYTQKTGNHTDTLHQYYHKAHIATKDAANSSPIPLNLNTCWHGLTKPLFLMQSTFFRY